MTSSPRSLTRCLIGPIGNGRGVLGWGVVFTIEHHEGSRHKDFPGLDVVLHWVMADDGDVSERRADVFVDLESDPRGEPPTMGGERETLTGFLRWQRETLELKCSGLSPEELARRSVEPSTMSLLGLLRHMSDVERGWFRWFMAGEDAPDRFSSEDDPGRGLRRGSGGCEVGGGSLGGMEGRDRMGGGIRRESSRPGSPG